MLTPDVRAEILYGFDVLCQSIAQIAEELGLAESTVKTVAFRNG